MTSTDVLWGAVAWPPAGRLFSCRYLDQAIKQGAGLSALGLACEQPGLAAKDKGLELQALLF